MDCWSESDCSKSEAMLYDEYVLPYEAKILDDMLEQLKDDECDYFDSNK